MDSGSIRLMMSGMQGGTVAKLKAGRDMPRRMITLVFDGTAGPMRFEVGRTEWVVRNSRPRREDQSRVPTRQ
jgi:hypothetical protein